MNNYMIALLIGLGGVLFVVLCSLLIDYLEKKVLFSKDKDIKLVDKLRKYYGKALLAENETKRDYWKEKVLSYIENKIESFDTIQMFYIVVNYMTKLKTLDMTKKEFEEVFKEEFSNFYNNVETRNQDFDFTNVPSIGGDYIDPVDFTYAIFDYIDEESFSKAKHFDIKSLRREFQNDKKMLAFFENVINIRFR